jgi:hypothetical protein
MQKSGVSKLVSMRFQAVEPRRPQALERQEVGAS